MSFSDKPIFVNLSTPLEDYEVAAGFHSAFDRTESNVHDTMSRARWRLLGPGFAGFDFSDALL
nr:C557 [uncultured bacterium]